MGHWEELAQLAGVKPAKVRRQCCHLHPLKVRGIGTQVIKNQEHRGAVGFGPDCKSQRDLFIWYQMGHSGNVGQEVADGLAKEAAREIQQIRVTEVTLKDVKQFVQCKTAKAWQNRWQNHKGAAKNFIRKVDRNKIKYMKKMSKINLGVIFQGVISNSSNYLSWSIWPSYK